MRPNSSKIGDFLSNDKPSSDDYIHHVGANQGNIQLMNYGVQDAYMPTDNSSKPSIQHRHGYGAAPVNIDY